MINKIIGIGDGGSQIAEHFKKYYDYSVAFLRKAILRFRQQKK